MSTILLTEENLDEYKDYIVDDIAENIGRIFYRAVLSLSNIDHSPDGLILWRLVNMETEMPKEAVIEWFDSESEEVAKALLDRYREETDKVKITRSSFVLSVQQGRKNRDLLKRAGFTIKLFEGDNIVCTIGELKKMPILNMNISIDNAHNLVEMNMRRFRKEITRCVEAGRYGVCEDLSYLPMSYFDLEVSSYVEKGDVVEGMQLYHRTPSGNLEIKLLIAWGKDFKKIFAQLFKKTLMSALGTYSDDTKVILNRHNEAAILLTEKLFPRSLGCPVYTGERKEI